MHLTKNTAEKCVMARVMRQKQMHQRNFHLKEYGTWEAAARAKKGVSPGYCRIFIDAVAPPW